MPLGCENMPYKNKKDRQECARRYYLNNKDKCHYQARSYAIKRINRNYNEIQRFKKQLRHSYI